MENNKPIHIYPESKQRKGAKQITYIIDDNGCFISVNLYIDRDGYPKVYRMGKKRPLSRYIWFLEHGEFPPDNMVVRHKCDNPNCINPKHLELGTVQDNIRDKIIRKRQPKGYTPKKVTPDLEVAILNDNRNSLQISISLGLNYHAVLRVKSGQRKEYNSTSKPHSKVMGKPRKRKKRSNSGKDGQGRKAA